MTQSTWHVHDIAAAMRAVAMSSDAIAQHINTPEMQVYRLGFDTALAALAVSLGINWPTKEMVKR